jgi:hypothetical protein
MDDHHFLPTTQNWKNKTLGASVRTRVSVHQTPLKVLLLHTGWVGQHFTSWYLHLPEETRNPGMHFLHFSSIAILTSGHK